MKVLKLTSAHKPTMRNLVAAIHADQGLLPQFYWPAELLGAELATAVGWGCFDDSELVAFLLYRELEGAWDISLVASHPQYRRRGFVEALFKHIIAAKSQGLQLWLEVHEENLPAQKLYEKLGFKEVRRRPRYYNDGASAILYTCL